MTLPVVGWIGLGAMGSGMVSCLASKGFTVKSYDVYPPSLALAVKAGCKAVQSPKEAATDVQVLGLMVVNALQVEDVLFGSGGVAKALQPGASIICFSTVPPTYLRTVRERLDALGKHIGLCDSPVSGGSTRAAQGTLTVMVSGTDNAISAARAPLDALTTAPEGKLSIVGDAVGQASDFKLINQVFCAIQICVSGEAMAYAKSLGLNPRMVHDIIPKASGASFMFGHRTPWMLRDDGIPKSAMTIIHKDIGIVMDEARLSAFPAPLCAVAEQVFTSALGAGLSREDDGRICKLWERFGIPPVRETGSAEDEIHQAKELVVRHAATPNKVLFVGLGAMGAPMALAVQRSGINVVGYDVSLEAIDRYVEAGGKGTSDMVAASVVVLITVSALQAEAALFGKSGLSARLPEGATIVICSTIAPSDVLRIQQSLDRLDRGLQVVDAPVSGGPSKATTGDLAIFASGEMSALERAAPILSAMSTMTGNQSNLHFLPGGLGTGSKLKLVNNLLAGVHLCAAVEAFAFANKKGMSLKAVYDVVSSGAAWSYMMVDRGPRMFASSPPVHSALDTFVKDLGLALAEAKRTNCPLWLTAAAHQQFVRASAEGLGREDDSAVWQVWKPLGVDLRQSL